MMDRIERLARENKALRAENERLKSCVSWMEEHHQMPSYSEEIDIARVAISRAEQAKPEVDK